MTFDWLDCDTVFFCEFCMAEYVLPEDCDECPICLQQDIQAVG